MKAISIKPTVAKPAIKMPALPKKPTSVMRMPRLAGMKSPLRFNQ